MNDFNELLEQMETVIKELELYENTDDVEKKLNLFVNYLQRGQINLMMNLFENSISDVTRAIGIMEKIMDAGPPIILKEYAYAYGTRAGAYHIIGDNENAFHDANKCIELLEKIQEDGDEGIDLNILCKMYGIRGGILNHMYTQTDLAISDYQKSISILERQQNAGGSLDENELGSAFMGLGQCYDQKSDYEKANSYYNKVLDIWERLFNEDPQSISIDDLAVVYMNRGANYTDLGEFEKSIRDYNKSIEIREKNAKNAYNPYLLSTSYKNRALSKGHLNDFAGSIEDLKKALNVLKDFIQEHPELQEIYEYIYENLIDIIKEKGTQDLLDDTIKMYGI